MTCQLRFPWARSPNAFMNSWRAAMKGLTSCEAGGAVSTPSEPGRRPRRASMKRGRRMATRSPMRRIVRSAQGTECLRDAKARVPGESLGDDMRHPHGEYGENDRAAHHFDQRTRGTDEVADLDQRDPTLGNLAPQANDQIEEEDLDPDSEGVGDQVLGECRGPTERREPEEEHPTAEHDVALDQHQHELRGD